MLKPWKILKPTLCAIFLLSTVIEFAAPLSAATIVSENITADTVWTLDGSPYVVTNNLIVQGTDGDDNVTTLTIEPGVEVRFNAASRFTIGGTSGDPGALVAQGTPVSPIRFTANSLTPQSGYWYGLTIENTADDATTILQHCIVEYTGYGSYDAIRVNNSSPTIVGCELLNNAVYDLEFNGVVGGSVTETTFNHGLNFIGSGQVAFANNIFHWDNSFPVRLPIDNVGPFVSSVTITDLDPSSNNGVEISGSTLTLDAVWTTAVPYIVTNSFTIQGTDGDDDITTLTLEPGVEVRFNAAKRLTVGGISGDPGALVAQGTAISPIRFTANSLTPQSGYWYGVNIENTADDATTLLQHCIVEYAGYGSYDAIRVNNSSPTISGCELLNNAVFDMEFDGVVGGSVTETTFNHGLNFIGSGQVAFANNIFHWDNSFPVRLPIDNVGPFVSSVTITDLDPSSNNGVEISGSTLTLDAVWTTAVPYIVTNSFTIQGTDGDDDITTLTLEPGVEVRFNAAKRLTVGGISGDPGALVAQGTAISPIRFTANSLTPQSGYWYGVNIENTADDATTLLQHCIVEYAGYGSYDAIRVNNSSPTISGCELLNNAVFDMEFDGVVGGSVTETTFNHGLNFIGSGQVAFVNNIFHWDNGYPIRLPADNVGPFVASATITGIEGSMSGGIEVAGGTLALDATWTDLAPYVIVDDLTIAGTDGDDGVTTLTLNPGVEIRFDYYESLFVADSNGAPGALWAVGTESEPILFTANTEAPDGAFWRNIAFRDASSDALCRLAYCIVEYAGINGSGAVSLSDALPIFRCNTIRYNSGAGLTVSGNLTNEVVYDCNNFHQNRYGIYIGANFLQVMLTGNNFTNNLEYGVHYGGDAPVMALNNWWGDTNGPNQNGDAVYGNVIFENWLTEPSTCIASVSQNEPPYQPWNPSPPHETANLPFPDRSVSFSWNGGDPDPSDTVVYYILWGTNPGDLSLLPDPQAQTAFTLSDIIADTTYYWQIVSQDNHGAQTQGPIWQFTTAAPQPDFVVSDLFMTPAAPEAGQAVSITATVQNIGTGTYIGSLVVLFQINGSYHSESETVYLAPNESAQFVESWTAQVGSVAVTAQVDRYDNVTEDDETNNTLAADLGSVVDTTAPEVYYTLPVANAVQQQVDQVDIYIHDQFGGTLNDTATADSIAIIIDGNQPIAGTVTISGTRFRFTPQVSPLVDGHYQVSLTAEDAVGNSLPYMYEFTVDNMQPDPVVITGGTVTSGTLQIRPAQNRSNTTTIPLTGTRDDDTSILVNGSYAVSLGSGTWSINRSFNQGDQSLEITSRDAAGNVSDPVWVDIFIDSIAPAISTVTPVQDSFLNTPPTSAAVTFTESGSGIDIQASDLQLLDSLLAAVPGIWQASADQLTFVPAAPLDDGTYTLQLRLRDEIGNTSAAVQSVFTVDTQAPPIPVIQAVTSPTHTVTQTIEGEKEAFSAIFVNDQVVVDHSVSTTWQYTVTLESGENQFNIAARDRAGNQSEAAVVTIVFDDIAPPPSPP